MVFEQEHPRECQPAESEPDVAGRLLQHIEVLQQLGTCCRLGLAPDENLLARLRQCDAWTAEIRAARGPLTSADSEGR